MSSAIGVPPLTSDPDTCTDFAESAACLVAARICVVDLLATPLPEDELPQPASGATAAASTARQDTSWVRRRLIAGATLSGVWAVARRLAPREPLEQQHERGIWRSGLLLQR